MVREMKNLFKPNFAKHRYNIVIEVYENSSLYRIDKVTEYPANFEEMVGKLECIKFAVIQQQSDNVKKESLKLKIKKEKQK
jgi:hypothetical protein